jgi:hypothetical protein
LCGQTSPYGHSSLSGGHYLLHGLLDVDRQAKLDRRDRRLRVTLWRGADEEGDEALLVEHRLPFSMCRGARQVGSGLGTLHVEVTNSDHLDVATLGEDAKMAPSDRAGTDESDSHDSLVGAGRTRNW